MHRRRISGTFGVSNEAVGGLHPVEALAELLHDERILLVHVGHLGRVRREQDHLLVKHLVVFEVVPEHHGCAVGG